MGFPDYLSVMISMNIRLCLPFTFLVIILCYMVRLDQVPVAYFVNLLICNLIHILTLLMMKANMDPYQKNVYIITHYFEMYSFGGVTSLCFRVCFALERLFLISWPEKDFIRQTKGLLIICGSVWLFCVILVSNVMNFNLYYLLMIFALLSAPVFIICLGKGVTSLPAVTSLPPVEKHRIMGMFVVIMLNYTVTMLPMLIYFIYTHVHPPEMIETVFTLFLFSPFMDLILFVFMCERIIDQLLMYVCCCRKESPARDYTSKASVKL